jgi:hypothetical protein
MAIEDCGELTVFARRTFLLMLMFCLAIPHFTAAAEKPSGKVAPKPLFRDPVHDGAADPSLIWNRAARKWMMFYTNRRADLPVSDPRDVAWVHGTQIGIAESKDGVTWHYAGIAKIPYGKSDYTFWAPDLIWVTNKYHMFVTVVPGVFHDWNAPREIIHLTSTDLEHWTFVQKLPLPSNRTIDPELFKLDDGTWRLWYKDENDHSFIHSIDSGDLLHWTTDRVAISDRASEAPVVFRWKENLWLIVDSWNGLSVYKSSDALHWTAQKDNLLATPGAAPTDRAQGHHADVVLQRGRAYLYYFVHQIDADSAPGTNEPGHRSVIQVVELTQSNGVLSANRNLPVTIDSLAYSGR